MNKKKLKFFSIFTASSILLSGVFINASKLTVFEVETINQNYGRKHTGYSQKLACTEEVKTKGNNYKTNTFTVTSSDHLTVAKNDVLQLKFSRSPNDKKLATGGRCVTKGSTTIFGDGEFSARLYIHSNVLQSDGVFTVAILPDTNFDKEKELDLFVINLLDDYGKPVIKFGNPGKSIAVDLEDIVKRKQWFTIKMTRKSEKCRLELNTDSGKNLFSHSNLPCNFGDKREIIDGVENLNRIVINSRARDYENSESSHISISDVKWVRHAAKK
jgi:hypothetical protein